MYLRSANRNSVNANNVGNVNSSGNVNNNNANNTDVYCAPDCNGNADKQWQGREPATAIAGSRHPCRPEGGESRLADGASPRAQEPISREDPLAHALSAEGLYESLQKCKRGTLWKTSVSAFWLNGWERCIRLADDLASGAYVPREPKRFWLTHPKRRECCSIGIRDRVYQRSLNDTVVYPAMTRSLVKGNAACQKGKGTDYARDLFERYLKNLWHHHGTDGWVLQLDVRGYYPNMRHDVCKAVFERHLDPESYARVEAILDTQYAGEVGFQPGSQLVQIAGISVLDELDHHVKERLRCKRYIRYMDDMLIVDHDRERLHDCKEDIARELAGMGYELNSKKTRVLRVTDRVPFLGFTFQLRPSGKVVRRMRPEKVRQERRKLRKLVALARTGAITREKCDQCAESWIGYARRGCTSASCANKMERFYQSLWKESDEGNQGEGPGGAPGNREPGGEQRQEQRGPCLRGDDDRRGPRRR